MRSNVATPNPEQLRRIKAKQAFVEVIVFLRQTTWLALLAAATFPILAKADSCDIFGIGPNCFSTTAVVDVDYGTLTLLAPDGSFLSTTGIVTAETDRVPFDTVPPGIPASFLALYPSLVGQLQSDPQSTFANFPAFLFTGLTNLEDANGIGSVPDPSAIQNEPPDPIAVAFNAQLSNVGGPFVTLSDTGYQTQPFSQAACDYANSIFQGACSGPVPGSQYIFTYQLGPETIDGNVYTTFVNFQIFSRDVTEQLVATPEPGMLLPLGLAFALLGCKKIKRG